MVQNNYETIKNFICLSGQEDEQLAIYREKAFKKGKNWSFDLKIGGEYFLSGDDIPATLDDENKFIIIKPGKFGSLITKEVISIDNKHIGLISVKFGYKQKGLINVSGFHVDPNYKGNVIFTVFNAGPKDIYIKKDDYVFMICFLTLTDDLKITEQKEGYSSIPTEMIEGLGGNSLTLMENNKRIEQLELYVKIMVGVAIGLIAVSLKHLID
jgi:dCTP deaminase